jgi:hypothetical protein
MASGGLTYVHPMEARQPPPGVDKSDAGLQKLVPIGNGILSEPFVIDQ